LKALEASDKIIQNKFYETLLGFVLHFSSGPDDINSCMEIINNTLSDSYLCEA
jgi:hypothetical protein